MERYQELLRDGVGGDFGKVSCRLQGTAGAWGLALGTWWLGIRGSFGDFDLF